MQAYTPQKNVPQESAQLYSIVLLYLPIKGGIYTLGSSSSRFKRVRKRNLSGLASYLLLGNGVCLMGR